MVKIKPFKGIRPKKEEVKNIASKPYDVINKAEAREIAKNNPKSFLHVIKPEIDRPDDESDYSEEVYKQGVKAMQKFMEEGIFFQDPAEYYYIYGQTMNGKTQYGLVAGASAEDYLGDGIKEHELTRPDKEEDRRNHVRYSNLNYEPVFFTYPARKEVDQIVEEVIKQEPEYDFTADDGVGHHFWVIKDQEKNKQLTQIFNSIPHTYVADGHHRSRAAATVGEERKKANPNHTGNEEYNFFMAVHFPDNQLGIIDYNRVVKDLNGLSKEAFLEKMEQKFQVEKRGAKPYKPQEIHILSMYLDGEWYKLTPATGTYDDNDPIGCLDVTILSTLVLDPILDITDLRNSKRIDFVGGIRGLEELQRRVDSGEMAVAFALYPVTMKQLMDIADTGNIMPPKTTWFEPKLRSGLVLHSLKDD